MEQVLEPALENTSPSPGAAAPTELTLADVMRLIEADDRLTPQRKRHWLSSLRRVAEGIGRPPSSIVARLTSLRHPISRLNAARMGIEEKSLSNHKSNARAAVLHVLAVTDAPRRGSPLSSKWKTLTDGAPLKPRRLLSGLSRHCSCRGLEPGQVNDQVVQDYFAHREATTFLSTGTAALRELARAWNTCVAEVPGWPQTVLPVPALPSSSTGPDWGAFPDGLRADIEAHLRRLAVPHRSASGRRRRPCKASTIATRRRELMAFARKACAAGVPLEQLTSLARLLEPATVTKTFERFLDEADGVTPVFVVDLGWKLHAIAREIGAPAEAISHLDDIRARLEEDRPPAMTAKNLAVIRAVMASDVWNEVTALPARLMHEAEMQLNRSPAKAATTATLAIQILILTRAPVRVGNLLSVRLGYNLTRPGGDAKPFHLAFPHYDVKNRVDLVFPLSPETSALILRYIDLFRPHLPGSRGTDWLFPGEQGRRSSSHASVSIAERLEREVGLRVTAHQFRHAAAALILKNCPGEYEFARRILGHLNIQTTIKFYAGLETFQASKQFGALIEDRLVERGVLPRQATGRKGPRG